MSTNESSSPDHQRQESSPLRVFAICTIGAATIIAVTSMMMALGAGLGSTPEDTVPHVSNVLWGFSGFAVIALLLLLLALRFTLNRTIARILAASVIVAGICCAAGWFINSDGEMPGNTAGNVMVISVILIPTIAGGIIFWKSREFSR